MCVCMRWQLRRGQEVLCDMQVLELKEGKRRGMESVSESETEFWSCSIDRIGTVFLSDRSDLKVQSMIFGFV